MAEQTLKDVANEALIGLIQSASDAMTFLKGEIPIAVRELLTYYSALYIVQASLCVIGLAVAALWMRKFWKLHCAKRDKPNSKHYGSDNYYDGWLAGLAFAPGIFATIICAGLLFIDVMPDLLKITLAPRIWLIEYASQLVK